MTQKVTGGFHEIWEMGRLWMGRQNKSWFNLGSDPEHILGIESLQMGRKFRHSATAGLRVERGYGARLRLYWYNGHYFAYTHAPAARR